MQRPADFSFRRFLRWPARLAVLAIVFMLGVVAYQYALNHAGGPDAANARLPAALRTTALGLGDIRNMQPYGHYRVSVQRDGTWQEAGRIAADAYLRTQEVTLESPAPAGAGTVRIRIEAVGGTNAHLDRVLLNGKPAVDSGWAPPAKLARADHDLLRIFGRPLELTFPAPADDGPLRIALTGRMQGPNMRWIPLSFPVSNLKREVTPRSDFYSYPLNASQGRIVVDGAPEELGAPFFTVKQAVGPGYPQSPTYGWVRNDDSHLYVALDFTPDVTRDEGDDYATVYADTPQGVKAFRATPRDTRWGQAAYVYTSRVPWQHTLYEFAIPLAELGISTTTPAGTPVRLAFDAYGTTPSGNISPAVAYNSIRNEYLLVYEDSSNSKIMGQRLGATGETISAAFAIGSTSQPALPAVGFDSNNGRYLAVWEDNGDDQDIKGAFVSQTGSVLTTPGVFSISAGQSSTTQPRVAFDYNNSVFMVVWSSSGIAIGYEIVDSNPDTLGDLLVETGSIDGNNDGTGRSEPDVAFGPSSTEDQFLIAFIHANSKIRTVRVPSDGSDPTAGAELSQSECYGAPAVAYAPDARRFLVVWESCGPAIYSHIIEADDGTALAGGNVIVSGTGDASVPRVAYDTAREEFLVSWVDTQENEDVFARAMGTDGTTAGSEFLAHSGYNTGNDVADQVLAYNSSCANFLFAANSNVGGDYDIYNTVYLACRGYSVTPLAGFTTEAGGKATISVKLQTRPEEDVKVMAASSDTTEGTVSPASRTFTSANWNTAQNFTVTGKDDDNADGNKAYTLQLTVDPSSDEVYASLDPPDVALTNVDNETGGITVGPPSAPTTEVGGTASFTVVLKSKPTANVSIGLTSSDVSEGVVGTATLTFTPSNWSTAQTVVVTGVDDDEEDGNKAYSIVTAAAVSGDSTYSGVNAADVAMTNVDDETPGITVSPPSGPTTELGSTASFSVVLNSQPTADVTIALSSSDEGEGTVDTATLTFTTEDWDTAKTIVVTGVDDAEADGHQTYTIVTAAAASDDAVYDAVDPADVAMFNIDDDGVPLALPLLTFTEEAPTGVDPVTGSAGTAFTFSVQYTSGLEKPPVIAELWIDLDGDGAYSTLAPAAAALHGPSAPPPAPGLPAVVWTFGALAALLLLLAWRMPSRLATGGAMAAVGLAVMAALLSCSSGGGDASTTTTTTTEEPPTVQDATPTVTGDQEVYKLTGSALNDGDYTNGETYEVTVTLENAGSIKYRFVFYDDTFPAYGLPTAEQTLTVE